MEQPAIWYPLPVCSHAVAKKSYTPTTPSSNSFALPLRLNDELFVLEQSSTTDPAWYRGYLFSQQPLSDVGKSVIVGNLDPRIAVGIFPASYVTLADSPDTTITPPSHSPIPFADNDTVDLPILAEITAALEEWCPRHMHELLRSQTQNNAKLATMSTLIADLVHTRKSLLLNLLSDNDKSEAVKSAVWTLVRGNKLISGDVIVRDETSGAVRTGRDDDDLVQLFRDQQVMALSTHSSAHAESESSGAKDLLHLMMRVSRFAGTWEDGMYAKFYICDKKRIISEAVQVDSGSADFKALFVDLRPAVAKDDIFMVVEVYETIYMTTQMQPVRPAEQGQWTGPINAGQSAAPQPQSYTIQGRRGVAVGIVDVGRVLREKAELEREMVIRMFAAKQVEGGSNEVRGGWGTLRTRLAQGSADGIQRSPKLDKVHVSFRAFASPNWLVLTTASPSLFSDLVACPKPLFATFSTVTRDELYLTLGGVSFASHVVRSKSLYYLTLSAQQPAPIMFRDSEQQKPSSTWTSCVVARDEKVGECVCISPLTRGTDVVITVHTVDGRVIGQTLFPLWVEGVIAKDGPRTLSVTNSQGLRIGTLDISSCLVSTALSADETLLALNQWRRVRNSANGQTALLNVLRQIDYVGESEIIKLLPEVLDSLFGILAWKKGNIDFEDSVFAALVHVVDVISQKGVNVRSILDDYIQGHFNYPIALAPLLYGYQRLLSNHVDPDVGVYVRSLLKIGKYILRFISVSWDKYQSQESISIALGTFPKVLRHLFQQLCRIVEQDEADYDDPDTAATIVAHQTLALDHFAEYLPELKSFFTDSELLELAIDFMESSASGCSSNPQLAMHRLVFLQSYTKLWLFSSSTVEVRKELASQTIVWIRPYFSAPTDADVATPAAWNAWQVKVRLCCSVLAHQFRILWPLRESCSEICGLYVRLLPEIAATFVALQHELKNPSIRAIAAPKFKHEFSVLFPETFPFPPPRPVDTSAKKMPFDELSIELTLLQAVLSEFATYDATAGGNGGGALTEHQAITLMSNVLSMCDAVIRGDAFPTNWISVYIFLHRSILSCLEFISLVLVELFLPHNDGEDEKDEQVVHIWYKFFRTLMGLVGSEALAMESFAEQKRRAVWAVADDVRERGALLLSKMWDSIGKDTSGQETLYKLRRVGGFQTRFVARKWCDGFALVGQTVELWGSQHEILRMHALGLLRSMIVCEWNARKRLDDIQSDIIDALESMFHKNSSLMADSFSKGTFVDVLFGLFPVSDDPLCIEVHKMLTSVSRLLDLLVDLHSLPDTNAYNDDRILCTLNLMQFLKDLDREDAFVRYVHQLIQMQELSGHYAEAGLALGLHAAMYEWRTDVRLPALAEPKLLAQTSFDRRETLYLQMVKYFALGNAPELALSIYKELARVYESIAFDLDKLATVSASIAKIYREELSASAAARPQPQFFRVVYHGLGFHRALRGKQFIVQGKRWEKLAEFTDRLQNVYPEARVVTTAKSTPIAANKHVSSASTLSTTSSSTIGDTEAANVEGQFLQITAVSPEPTDALAAAVGIGPNERDFFLRSDLRRFSVSRPVKSVANAARASCNPADIWVEKTVFVTKEAFPTILRRSVIQSSEITRVSPLTNAADSVSRKTSEILHIARQALSQPDESHSAQLSMVVSGAVDAPVNGGVQQYRALLAIYASDEDAESQEQKKRLDNAIVDYVAVLKYALLVHARVVSSALRPLHDSLIVLFERNFRAELRHLAEECRVIDGMDIISGTRADRASEDARSVLSVLTPQTTVMSGASSQHWLESSSTTMLPHSSKSKSTTPSAVSTTPVTSSSLPSMQLSHESTTSLPLDRNASTSNISVSVTNLSQQESAPSISSNKAPSAVLGQDSIASRMGRRISKMKIGSTKQHHRSVTTLGSFVEK
ncbi:uncharacterized protein V1513DRAFT_125195 [Lipomyces chichibuensis]|uniref:uncharacterized protein n=1 Tax=Lipomyces chichibuensis TaxID=1546026 RepID=UPI003342ED50